MTAIERKILTDYLGWDYNRRVQDWNLVMPAVRKIGEDLLPYWKQEITDAWALQTQIEFYVVNVKLEKTIDSIIKAIQWLTTEK